MQHHHPQRDDDDALERLVARASAGDERAWETLVERFGASLRATTRAYRLRHHDAEDVMQTAWLRLLTHIEQVREPARLGAYLRTTARHEGLRFLRREQRERLALAQHAGCEVPGDDGLDEHILRSERGRTLHAAVGSLPASQRRIIELMLAAPALSYDELSAALEIPQGSIGPLRGRGLSRLADDPELSALASK